MALPVRGLIPRGRSGYSMSESFSTDRVPTGDRLDAWLVYAKQVCGDCRFHFPKGLPFHGLIERRTLAGGVFSRFSSTPVSFVKFPSSAADSRDRDSIIITQLHGTRRYCQKGTMAVLAPGDTTLIDAGQPWTSDCNGQCTRLYLRVPHWLLGEHLSERLPILPRIIGKHGRGAALFRLATSLYQEAEAMSLPEGSASLDAYLTLLAGCLGCQEVSSTPIGHCRQLRPRIEHHIECHLSDTTLNPGAVARAAGISVRHLHRLFAVEGCTVLEWIRERRLERCRTDLADLRLSNKSITDIALGWGFSDSAHFSHCFHKEFGLSPRQFRLQARANLKHPQSTNPDDDFLELAQPAGSPHN
jgi:AraC family transcriptional regulator, positive regulator of tynA and feaB